MNALGLAITELANHMTDAGVAKHSLLFAVRSLLEAQVQEVRRLLWSGDLPTAVRDE